MKRRLMYSCTFVFLCFVLLVGQPAAGQEASAYRLPPEEIVALADTPGIPFVDDSPDGKVLMIIERPALASIKELSQPELKLAGLRINPRTNGRSRARHYNKIRFKNLASMREYPIIGLPEDAQISNFTWSPDGQKVALTLTRDEGIELWIVQVGSGKAARLTDAVLNAAMYGMPYEWLPDSRRILYTSVTSGRGKPPARDPVPKGPVVQSNEGEAKKAPVRTYQDLLKNRHDEALFTFYTTCQLMITDLEGNKRAVGEPAIINRFDPSPDGTYILVQITKPPFSYLVPYYHFPESVEVWHLDGRLVKKIADIPLNEDILPAFDAVMKGPRGFGWRSDAPAVLYWIEAQDGGDPAAEADIRDRLYFLAAPFSDDAAPGPGLKYRLRRVRWGSGNLALVEESWWKTRKTRTLLFAPDAPDKPPRVVFDRSSEDRYGDPGRFVLKPNRFGRYVLLTDKTGQYLYLRGLGASPEGNRPFIDRFDIKTLQTSRLWRSQAPYYETVTALIDIDKHQVLTRREGKKVQPNYFIRSLKSGKLEQVTHFPHPYPLLKGVEKQLIKYKRADGLDLTGSLYLPPGYKKSSGPLPVAVWAYPWEFKSKSAAGQVTDSPYRFIWLYWGSPILWVSQGYAVFDDISMPVVGEGDEEPNDTYVEQLVANARAAIDKLVDLGIADRKRIAVGGHSYGAFMTANLLAHSRLFAAGIARSGAYNRTLTPFGFQAEERTLWEALAIYIKMSPFMHAHKVKDPLLLIHGEMDNNSGTFPIQSKRFYHALKGHGAPVRLVMLPFESHSYRARESVMHVLWETHNWLEKYVKNRK